MRIRTTLAALVAAGVLAALLSACGGGTATTTTAGPTADGATLLQERCTVCHTLDRVTSKQWTQDQWAQTVARMEDKGAQLSAAERAVLVDHLAQTYGP